MSYTKFEWKILAKNMQEVDQELLVFLSNVFRINKQILGTSLAEGKDIISAISEQTCFPRADIKNILFCILYIPLNHFPKKNFLKIELEKEKQNG